MWRFWADFIPPDTSGVNATAESSDEERLDQCDFEVKDKELCFVIRNGSHARIALVSLADSDLPAILKIILNNISKVSLGYKGNASDGSEEKSC